MKFYKFAQNNAGGKFKYDENVARNVFIESENAQEANNKAEKIGIYFDGVLLGTECSYCEDRWCRASEDDGMEFLEFDKYELKWRTSDGPIAVVHFEDGKKIALSVN